MKRDILAVLADKWEDGTRPADLYAEQIAARPRDYLDAILSGLASKNKRVQGGCAELASLLSAEHPALLYPHVDVFVANLGAKAPILRWEAVCTLGNLAKVDRKKVLPEHVDTMAGLLASQSIVLQGHAVRALAKIAQQYPALAGRILAALLRSEPRFPGSRVGYVVEAMEAFASRPSLAPTVRGFLARHAESEHAPVARKAKRALKMMGA